MSLLSRVDTKHRDMIHDAQMDYYGTRLATCSSDRSIKIFEIKTNSQPIQVAELAGHTGPVWQVTWSHPSFESVLASCSYDHKVFVWKEMSANKWTKIYEGQQHEASVNSIQWAPYQFGLILACGSTDKSISVLTYSTTDSTWSASKISSAHDQGCNAVSWCPATNAGSLIETEQEQTDVKRIVSGGNDNMVKIWRESSEGWRLEQTLEAHSDWVRDVAWAPATGFPTYTIASCAQDKRVIIWRCADLNGGRWQPKLLPQFDDVVWHVSWSMCGTILAVSCGDNKVSLWKESLDGQWVCISGDKTNEEKGRNEDN